MMSSTNKEDIMNKQPLPTPTMFIMRGLPGSGKSTLAKKIAELHDAVICSADDFFMKGDVYDFNPRMLHAAHATCQEKARKSLVEGKHVVIDNTNVRLRELKTYFEIAENTNSFIIIYQPDTPWAFDVEECFKRNTHNVPRDVIQRMKDEWYNMSNYDE